MTDFLTKTAIRELFAAQGLGARKRHGQNFLIDRNARDKIISLAPIPKGGTVVEIGPGLGALTGPLLEHAGRLFAFEIDTGFCTFLRKKYGDRENFSLIEGDFLETPPAWWDALPAKVFVVSNTPYRISVPIVFALLRVRNRWESALLTVQKEVGERLTAPPGGRNYGSVSVQTALYTDARICYFLRRELFFPRPDVDSVVIQLQPKSSPEVPPEDEEAFDAFLPAVFSGRRKQLANVLNRRFSLGKAVAAEQLAAGGFSPAVRAEKLSPGELYRLFRIIEKSNNETVSVGK